MKRKPKERSRGTRTASLRDKLIAIQADRAATWSANLSPQEKQRAMAIEIRRQAQALFGEWTQWQRRYTELLAELDALSVAARGFVIRAGELAKVADSVHFGPEIEQSLVAEIEALRDKVLGWESGNRDRG